MYLIALLFTLCLVVAPTTWQATDPYAHQKLLNFYQTASKDEKIAEQFHSLMHKYQGKDPLKMGYKAVSNAIMAKHTWSPYSKLKYLKQSSQIFDQAVALDNTDPEVRFLRYSIENYIPRYLNMSSHLEEDKRVFMAAILKHPRSGMPSESVKIMREFLLRKELLTAQEKEQVEKLKL
ncbi:hypothetical protein [Rufibacter sp. LB8]|uniref:hypothetical protein n=1 Tax=Rufibacter sp. LB8 TaxID=2777781 RepID=UPI00178C3B8D|nr:hypothetical protein [Rufibacter sp. LB8]